MTSSYFSLEPSARPPDTMIFAEVSSGRSCLAISAPTKLEMPASPPAETASTAPEPPEVAAFSKAVPRTVRTSFASDDSTVAIALPAYTGRRNRVADSTAITSLSCGAPSNAATRGIRSLPKVVDGPRTWLNPAASFATCGASTAASAGSLAGFCTSSTRATPAMEAAAAATGAPSAASTATVMSASGIAPAQLTHFATEAFSLPPACSATIRMRFIRRAPCAGAPRPVPRQS